MKKFLCWLTDWIGWFFVEVACYMHELSNYGWAYDQEGDDEYRWFLKPYEWVANGAYWLGNFFYGCFDE